jgi:hypothetical protein
MGDARSPSALSLGGRNSVGVGTFQPSFGFKDFSSCSPAASLRRRSPKTVTTSPWMGRGKLGCDLGSTLSFKDVNHPCWAESEASRGSTSCVGRLATSSSSFWWWKPSSSSTEEASSSHAGEGELLLTS